VWCCFSAACQDYDNLEMRFKGCREAVSFPYRRSSCGYDNFCTLTHFVCYAALFLKELIRGKLVRAASRCVKATVKIIKFDKLLRTI
jgi:hypothetical protein